MNIKEFIKEMQKVEQEHGSDVIVSYIDEDGCMFSLGGPFDVIPSRSFEKEHHVILTEVGVNIF